MNYHAPGGSVAVRGGRARDSRSSKTVRGERVGNTDGLRKRAVTWGRREVGVPWGGVGRGPNEGRGRESETVDGCLCVCVCASVCRLPALHGEPAHGTERERERYRERKKKRKMCVRICVNPQRHPVCARGPLVSGCDRVKSRSRFYCV